jgi:hypothetical protein
MTTASTLVLATGGLTVARYLSEGTWPAPRVFIGTGLAGLFIVAAGTINATLATGFATVLFLTALLTHGAQLARAVARIVA